MANFFGFSSDKADVYTLLIDGSGSMADDTRGVRTGLESFGRNFDNFSEANSIVVSKSVFRDENVAIGDFRPIGEFNTDYYADGGTPLYYAIVKAAEHLKKYMEEIARNTGFNPRATFVVFSDGGDNESGNYKKRAFHAIEELNCAGVTTVFVAFGDAIRSDFGEKMGFQSTKDVNDREMVVEFFEELSHSCKEQSKSLKALGSNFFSKAVNNSSSAGYSNSTAQALEDEDWIDSI